MIALLVAAVALAQPAPNQHVVAESDTIAELRHDLFGASYVPAYQYVSLQTQRGHTRFDGFAGLEAISGLDHPADLDLYLLNAHFRTGRTDWVVGRQEAVTSRRRQTFDGVRWSWSRKRTLVFDAWAGVARHQDLDDFLDGAGMARASVRMSGGPGVARVGVQLDGGPGTPLLLRQDAQGALTLGGSHPARLEGAVAVAEPDFTVEWAQVDLYAPRLGVVEASLHARHRDAPDWSSVLGDAILHDLALGAVQQAGAQVRVYGAKWARFSASYDIVRYPGLDGVGPGHEVEVTWVPPLGTAPWRVTPSYTWRKGPEGSYHAATAVGTWDLDEKTSLEARAAAVPYRKGDAPWRMAADVGLEGHRQLTRAASVRLLGDIATDPLAKVDVRLGAGLTVVTP